MTAYVIQISSGVGPSEVRRFVFKLADRMERLCERHGLEVEDVSFHGDEGAPRSVALRVRGDALGVLGGEQGCHVLVHRSKERGRQSRKRWFASVTTAPAPQGEEDDTNLRAIDRGELVITACRAGGPGGQHVNKVSSAVRAQHVPSGISVRVASERSQKSNIEHAIRRIASLLHARVVTLLAESKGTRRLSHYRIVRGSPVRTYTLSDEGQLWGDGVPNAP